MCMESTLDRCWICAEIILPNHAAEALSVRHARTWLLQCTPVYAIKHMLRLREDRCTLTWQTPRATGSRVREATPAATLAAFATSASGAPAAAATAAATAAAAVAGAAAEATSAAEGAAAGAAAAAAAAAASAADAAAAAACGCG